MVFRHEATDGCEVTDVEEIAGQGIRAKVNGKWAQVYKTTGTPCSCWMCRGEEYDRKGYKQEILRITKESEY